jgi:hypothetical protein
MGTLRSHTNHTGMVVDGVLLGDPVELDDDPTTYEWDDHRIPTGEILADGTIVPDATDAP